MLFLHAALAALVAALLGQDLRELKFTPCVIYQLERRDDSPWRMTWDGGSNGEIRDRKQPDDLPTGV